MKKNSGVTLIALVISIIVMLILAGVSLNATVGENGVLTQAKKASITQKFASYMEQFEMNKAGAMIEQGITEDFMLNLLGTNPDFLKYVSNIREEDKEKFEIIAGYLVYIGNDEDEKQISINLKMKDKNDQVLYDSIGKEFAYYVSTWENAKANGIIPTNKLNNFLIRSNVPMNEWKEYSQIPDGKYDNEFVLDFGYISYIGTNEERLILLANSQYLRNYIASGNLKLSHYVAPENGTLAIKSDGKYQVNDWIIEEIGSEGSIKIGAIIGYTGNQTVVNIPDIINGNTGDDIITIKIITVKGDGTNNIFKTNGSSNVNVKKVTVAKGIKNILNKGLANLGKNIQCHILYVGNDLCLGNDKSDINVLGYEGIENICGSFTFVVPSSGNYTFKLWGASGGDGYTSYLQTRGSQAGLGGYSQGTISLLEGEKIYIYIGGTGIVGTADIEDGSGGYNGGGSGSLNANGSLGNGGGGATDIRYNGTEVSEIVDYRILIAAGGGGADNATGETRGGSDDGTGGYGGGTELAADKTTWSGFDGYINGSIVNSSSKGSKWILNEENIYEITGNSLFFGENSVFTITDLGGGGGGYYGGKASIHNNGGGAGGSAYADIEGKIKLVSNIQGYSGYENGNGAEMQGKYGNGKIIISK